jgi:hypothetical protein
VKPHCYSGNRINEIDSAQNSFQSLCQEACTNGPPRFGDAVGNLAAVTGAEAVGLGLAVFLIVEHEEEEAEVAQEVAVRRVVLGGSRIVPRPAAAL